MDQRRIAILPFRVTAADTLFGEGLAELLANQLNNDDLRAAHMGSVLRAWRRAGGGMRSPLDQAGTQRVAREVGAGRVVEGSVVGVGPRLTLSANVVTVPGGASRRVGPIAGPIDSLETMISRLAAGLLGAAGNNRVDLQVRLTDSPDAMRAYLEGLAHFRRRETAQAATAFERAIGFDSSFARAAFMRYQTSTFSSNPADLALWMRRTQALKDRLSRQDRVLMRATIGETSEVRTPAQHLADRQHAVTMLPESPEAQYELADYLMHSGSAHNTLYSGADVARDLLRRSLALDTQALVAEHLLELALWQQDTASLRALWPVFSHTSESPGNVVSRGLTVAEFLADASLRATLVGQASAVPTLGAWAPSTIRIAMLAGLGFAGIQRIMEPFALPNTAGQRNNWARSWGQMLVETGRPGELLEIRRLAVDSLAAQYTDFLIVATALFEAGDTASAAAALNRMGAAPPRNPAMLGSHRCITALWRQRDGQPVDVDADFLEQHNNSACAAAIALQESRRTQAPDLDARIVVLDSILRRNLAQGLFAHWFENRILARVLEERGNRNAALNAIRLRFINFGQKFTESGDLRIEGRLAALVGDTAGAVRAYRRYLGLRRDAEPSLIPQRDSVAAALTALQGRR